MTASATRLLPSDFAEPNDAGVPEVTVAPLAALAARLGCDIVEARGIALRDGVLLDAWKWEPGSTFTFPEDHRFWIPEAWMLQTVETAKAMVAELRGKR